MRNLRRTLPGWLRERSSWLDELEAILNEDTIDKGKVSRVLRFFKTNASWVVPILTQAITKTLGG